ncbi:helix-turn-helix transcriptional regulator [Actinomyces vulturis]|uniref:helix-turn-helix transcriptional regulator n=1 Tax=Actinomyces vulturis TaxID=1857645 RepID=UPI00082F21E2|nr:WYL domain-containing protein [Actinomyces vulturis]
MPRPLTADRVTRLLALPVWVCQNPGITLKETAEHFGITVPELRRDIERLWMTGTPGGYHNDLVDFDGFAYDEGKLMLVESQGLDVPVRLSIREAQSLLLSARITQQAFAHDMQTVGQCQEIIDIVQSLLTNSLTHSTNSHHEEDSHASSFSADPAVASSPDVSLSRVDATVDLMSQAIANHRCVSLTYVDATDQRSERVIEPLEILSDGTSGYVCCYCHLAKDLRHLRLDRIVCAELLDRVFVPRKTISHNEKVHQSQNFSFSNTDARTIKVHVSSSAQWLVDRLPCVSENNADGSIMMTIEGRNERWLIRLLLALAPSIYQVDSPEIMAKTREEAQRALRAYEQLESIETAIKSKS